MLNEFYMSVNGKEFRFMVIDFLPESEKFDENDELVSIENCYQCLVEDVEKDEILKDSQFIFESDMKEIYDVTYEN